MQKYGNIYTAFYFINEKKCLMYVEFKFNELRSCTNNCKSARYSTLIPKKNNKINKLIKHKW